MALTLTTPVDGPKYAVVTAISTSADDLSTPEPVVDFSALSSDMGNGVSMQSLSIMEIWYDVQGYSSVLISFDADTNDDVLRLSEGSGYLDFRFEGGLHNPRSTGFSGDILATTPSPAPAAETFTIRLVCKKKA